MGKWTLTYWDFCQAKFEKKIDLWKTAQIWIGQMVFLKSEKWASDQSQVIDKIFDE